jgi:hypothetical protein
MLLMKKRRFLLFLTGLIIASVINSCKKSGQNPIEALFTGGTWQLASVQVFNYIGNAQTSVQTFTDSCKTTQFFTFSKDNTCVYTNFDCITQTSASAKWSLAPNQLYLISEVVCKDTSAAGTSQPFINAQIINLGQYSLVLNTGDIQPNYSLTKPRKIIQYGFIREKIAGTP